ncbi:MAG: hypothetical protein IKG93_07880 [Clostridiales bacterium]|nr:hypothetical protein [Clostridiales bacterium]
MAILCSKCGAPLVLASEIKSGICSSCASQTVTDPETDSVPSFASAEPVVQQSEETHHESEESTIDCKIYACSSCGGQIIHFGKKASERCIYCGKDTVYLARQAKEPAPEFILPFSVSEEKARTIVKEKLNSLSYIPRKIRKMEPTDIRRVYVPYWICDVMHAESVGRQSRQHEEAIGHLLLSIKGLPLDASTILSDNMAHKLEPYTYKDLELFNESALNGSYAAVADLKNHDLRAAAKVRAEEIFRDELCKDFQRKMENDYYKDVRRYPFTRKMESCMVDRDVKYAYLPVWVISYQYKKKHGTILVNGNTGEVVAPVPWKKAPLLGLGLCIFTVVAASLSFLIYKAFDLTGWMQSNDRTLMVAVGVILFCLQLPVFLFVISLRGFKDSLRGARRISNGVVFHTGKGGKK